MSWINTDSVAARQVAERVQVLLAAENIAHAASVAGSEVTASIGVTTLVPTAVGNSDELIARADRQLYLAKTGGRDRIMLDDAS